jgi:stage III sporulation protein AG
VPYVTSTDKPTVSGVLVVAQGGGKPQINNDISNAVSALFDVPMHKIKIAKMISREE